MVMVENAQLLTHAACASMVACHLDPSPHIATYDIRPKPNESSVKELRACGVRARARARARACVRARARACARAHALTKKHVREEGLRLSSSSNSSRTCQDVLSVGSCRKDAATGVEGVSTGSCLPSMVLS